MQSLKTKITTPKIEETQEFYQRIFSMTVVEEWDSPNDRGVIIQLSDGSREAMLEIYFGETIHDFSGLSLQFRVDDLDAFVAAINDPFEGPVDRPWGSRYVYLTDPNGVSVIVYDGGW